MRRNILILTPDPADSMFNGRWRDILADLVRCLTPFDINVDHAPWTKKLQNTPGSSDLVLPLLAWGYQKTIPLWFKTCTEWQNSGIPIQNPPQILKWNTDKHYLEQLTERGASVVPSFYCDKISYAKLKEAVAIFGVDKVVLKPTVSATAYKTSVWEDGRSVTDPPDGPCIIQPYLSSIETEGEISLIFVNGQFSHALRKKPLAGDFRVQPEFGGCLTPCVPDQSAIKTAEKIHAHIDDSLLYARIDLVLGDDNRWLLLEAELIEPDLFLGFDKKNGELLGEAIRQQI